MLPAGYDSRTTRAVRSVLLEIGQILASFRGRFVVVGGAVPWLLLANPDMPHVGTMDVDLGLDAAALGDGEYVNLVQALQSCGYEQNPGLRRFQLIRRVPIHDGTGPVDIVVDFLMPRHARYKRNRPPLLREFAVQRADGASLALQFPEVVQLEGEMPMGGRMAMGPHASGALRKKWES